ncbi:DUF4232 domain-containing protein [Streptomyces longispororuber]|uniref:DUF4232 domain-containing protein n=1 Tax=Streptomyces longispororuber TaxID=68230 RepID=UPI00210D9E13|nr:DUF4232 domain-containing protein [Streptomyces longispororuber]MCQ4210052.1 DUF4232 domain-containing protein [Streptomyces longispororuber]
MTRTIARTTVLAAAAAVLGLSLTACSGGDSGTKDEGAAAPAAATTSTGTNTGTGDDKGATSTTGTGASKSSGAAQAGAAKTGGTAKSGGTTAKNAPECKVGSLTYSLKRKNPEQQGDHLLITAVNTSGAACTVQKFPVVTPGEANGDVPVAKDDVRPAQPLLVPAGGTVYSALAVYQETKAEDDYFTSIRLSLVMNDSDASAASVTLKTPGEVEYAGKRADGIEVLSWNPRMPYAG